MYKQHTFEIVAKHYIKHVEKTREIICDILFLLKMMDFLLTILRQWF